MKFSAEKYTQDIDDAVAVFWQTRNRQMYSKTGTDQGNRGAVTGGKQMAGFVALMTKVAVDVGITLECIYTKQTNLPGYFRPTKDWDFLIISPTKKLIAVVEFKSQVGSFGNNFNNRTEEALGNAVDFWTAFREKVYPSQQPPWLGYLMVLESTAKATAPVRVNEPHFKVLDEFRGTSYTERYVLFCQKLMLERHYSATSLICTSVDGACPVVQEELAIGSFLLSFMGYLQGKLNEFD